MPTYQYACTNPECGNQFELVQSFTDPAASECPVCGQPVRKRFGSVGVVFKGSGFYRTDSRAAASASAPSSTKGESSAKGESKSDAKPAESSAKSEKSAAPAASGSGSSGGSSGKAAATA
ncbi:MAG TPA: FmdB family zinc ribbon protein [Jatrophihabitantaceae bacterium]|jgi:putative FmdB family regulatory protein